MRVWLTALLSCGPVAGPALAHDLRYEIGKEATAVSVRLFFTGGTAFSFESYEIYRPGEKVPFQVGRTDALGRLVFLPDRAGRWRVKAFSEDGHGVDFSLSTGRAGGLEKAAKPLVERYAGAVFGVGLIFGVFGLVSLFAGRRRTA